ncbi:hypothetical protein RJT34_28585 [Clitoria ternatea]|uniref:Uncharacterized protein n=1 Tax=Clitoria ternatea TaxID=43366 RepID=A0AAN9IH09_CLITE
MKKSGERERKKKKNMKRFVANVTRGLCNWISQITSGGTSYAVSGMAVPRLHVNVFPFTFLMKKLRGDWLASQYASCMHALAYMGHGLTVPYPIQQFVSYTPHGTANPLRERERKRKHKQLHRVVSTAISAISLHLRSHASSILHFAGSLSVRSCTSMIGLEW